ncbi:hypothetical protein Scep_028333 [Stephania cephalantha]|uniref:Protein kinase domain-containing protein n=1 Tax=Stephania cephalantha TaxID=152367 RepID=A0AAP0HM01_9MAGN
MDEEGANSWLRRAKFSHTVYQRLDSSRLPSISLLRSQDFPSVSQLGSALEVNSSSGSSSSALQSVKDPKLGSRTEFPSTLNLNRDWKLKLPEIPQFGSAWELKSSIASSSLALRLVNDTKLRSRIELPSTLKSKRDSKSKSKAENASTHRSSCDSKLKSRPGAIKGDDGVPARSGSLRSASPVPETVLSDAFMEARSDQKRFSTPTLRREEVERGILGKLFKKDSHSTQRPHTSKFSGPLKHFASIKISSKAKNKKDSAWTKFACGAHSRLYHGMYMDKPVAVKIIRPPDDDENGAMAARLEKQFNREVTLLSQLHHQNIIKLNYIVVFHGMLSLSYQNGMLSLLLDTNLMELIVPLMQLIAACKKPPVFCVVTEYLSGGSLRAFLHKLEKKEANCDTLSEDPGTYRWMAPEMIKHKHKRYGRKVDVYSFGLLLWEMLSGTIPYEDMTPIQAAYAVVNKNMRPVVPADCPSPLRTLVEQCWSLNPEKRPEFWQIVKILEQFESSLASDGTLNHAQNPLCHDHKKSLLHRIQKLASISDDSTPIPKPRIL